MRLISPVPTDQSINFRPVRSFVHRQSGLSKRRQMALATLSVAYSLPTHEPLKLEQIFQRVAPTVLEIGFGMGHHLLAQAQQHPEQNFLGIEVHRPGIAAVLVAIESLQLSNLRIIHADAVEVLNNCIANRALSLVQIFFPDPWPKKRHHKRRLIQPAFTKLLQNKLKKNSLLQLATDYQHYAEYMLSVLENTTGLKNNAGENKFSPRSSRCSYTKFETRGRQLGHSIWELEFSSTR